MKKYALAALLMAFAIAAAGCTEKQPDAVDTYTADPVQEEEMPEAPEETGDEVPEDIALSEGFRPMPKWEILGDAEERQGDETHPHIIASYPILMLDEETANAYPTFADKVSKLNDEIKSTAEAFVDEMDDIEVDDTEGINSLWENTETMEPMRFDTIVASFRRYSYSYTGGIHGFGAAWGTTYDMESGEELTIADVLTDAGAVIGLIEDRLLEKYDKDMFFDAETIGQTILEDYLEDPESLLWGLTEEGIRFFFSQYYLGPYASGSFEADFTYDELGELFNDAYRPAVG